ncbi:MAG: hypothetical protein F6J90_39165 [Moorea sp. SIOASIH]|uniref:hypothetical protein n=1 Tax=Moorena sp. SIOASIH TaxID=2607817 RepID=UPI0013B89B3C|nr:hypothetical protein [Moorena sp. SIOASIH]NEO42024.1 hypothetical protein [Moorena sp. SIOASIH]
MKYIQFSSPYSLLPTPYSLLPTPYSLLPKMYLTYLITAMYLINNLINTRLGLKSIPVAQSPLTSD